MKLAKFSQRRGFTLVELLVVIVIISILIALLVPVIAGAVRQANDATVSSEINQLAQALTEFKNRYGDYPPSGILLSDGGYNLTDTTPAPRGGSSDLTLGQLAERSQRYLRKFFPRAAMPVPSNPATYFDWNGNGQVDTVYLSGDECLVFFLGGMPQITDGSFSATGFCKDPVRPFMPVSMSTNRMMPTSFEFRADRLFDDDGDGFPAYIDRYGRPSPVTEGNSHYYAYFSAYGNNGYDPNDVNSGVEQTAQVFRTNPGIGGSYQVSGYPPATLASPSPNPYTSSTAVPSNGFATYINANSFQIISAGGDGYFGAGGQYGGDSSDAKLPVTPGIVNLQLANYSQGEAQTIRQRENDNLSNFTKGRLD